MLEKNVSRVLESLNKNYLFLIAAEKEAERLRKLPSVIREQFKKKIAHTAIEHIACNNIPEYSIDDVEDTNEEVVESQ